MPFCGNCGAEVAGGFCAKCGTPVGAAGAVPGGGAQFSPGPTGGAPSAAGLQENVAGALCYALGFVTGILFLVLAPYNQNPKIRFNAFQSIFFNIAWIIFHYGFTIVLGAMGYNLLGALFGILTSLVWLVIGLGGFLLWLLLMFKAYNNTPLVLPVIGPIAQRQAAGSAV